MSSQPRLLVLKQLELRRKYESIGDELAEWRRLVEKGQPLEKHHRQVWRLSDALEGMIGALQQEVARLEQAESRDRFFHYLPRAEYLILEVHRTWHYFRQKFTLRQGPPFGDLLAALDEFVWECYHPAFAKPPEPPLTFFSGEWSPLASSRLEQLVPETTSHPDAGRFNQLEASRLQHLVIPVISLPWYETGFLPEALLLAHETAHLVDYDLGLEQQFRCHLAAAGIEENRLNHHWLSWSAEVFADLYAVLCLGPAYVGALQALLSRSPHEVLKAIPAAYPPHHLRIRIGLAALRHLGFDADAGEYGARWEELYGDPETYAGQNCAGDVDRVVAAFLDRPFDGLGSENGARALIQMDALRWQPALQDLALGVKEHLLNPLESPTALDPRALLAGAQLAFQDEPKLQIGGSAAAQKARHKVVSQILAGRTPGVRAVGERNRQQWLTGLALTQDLKEADQAKGQSLAEALLQRRWPAFEEEVE